MNDEAHPNSRRSFLMSSALLVAGVASPSFVAAKPPKATPSPGIRAYRLFTGDDGNSHIARGTVSEDVLVEAESIEFKETPAHGSYDWHNDPTPQYVITLTGVLEFKTRTGETFTIHPGDVLIAQDHAGSGHEWRLVDNAPWKRAYIIFKAGADPRFVPDPTPGH